jgi:hypothetical protein
MRMICIAKCLRNTGVLQCVILAQVLTHLGLSKWGADNIPLAYLIQSTMDQCRIRIQGPSQSSEYTEKPFSPLQVNPIQLQ